MAKLRVIFFGTPEFAVPTLEALIAHPNMDVLAAVSQPDKPAGRNQKMHAPPVKICAIAHNIQIFQPNRLSKSPETIESLKALSPDVIVMVAFGQILKRATLELPSLGVINLHASLLPHYRGAAPINWAIINGDKITGNTTMFTEAGLDTGPMLLKQTISIDANTDSQMLAKEMSIKGAKLVIETLEKLAQGTLKAEPQDDNKATFAPILTKETGRIDWSKSAQNIHDLVRGLIPWPVTFTQYKGEPLKIWQTILPNLDQSLLNNIPNEPGTCIIQGKNLFVKCGTQGKEIIQLILVQPPNRAKLAVSDWLNGARLTSGERLG